MGNTARFLRENLAYFDAHEICAVFHAIYGREPDSDEYPADAIALAIEAGLSAAEARRVARALRAKGWEV